MANPERGELRLVVDGREFTLVLTINTMCDIEERTGKSFADVVLNRTLTSCRWLLWAGLQRYHGAEFPTPEDVGTLVNHLGVKGIYERAAELVALSQPADSAADQEKASSGRPPDAPLETAGVGSTSTLAYSG